MNGISLMIAAAAIGLEVSWEPGPGGKEHYTLRAESVLLGPLRDGKAIVSRVDAADRNLTRFQVILGETPVRYEAISQRLDSMVQYGWRPHENGGVDFMIQVTPERLQSLSQGVPIVGTVDPQVTDIRQIYVFAGVEQLPQELPKAAAPQPEPPSYTRGGGRLEHASAQVEDSTGSSSLQSGGLRGSSTWPGRRDNAMENGPRVNELPGRYPEDRTDWQHSDPAYSGARRADSSRDFNATATGTRSNRDPYTTRDVRPQYSSDDRNGAYPDARSADRRQEYDRRDASSAPNSRLTGGSQLQTYRDGTVSTAASYNQAAGGQSASNPSLTPHGASQNAAPVTQANWQQGYAAPQSVPNVTNPGVQPNVVQATPAPTEPVVQPWMPLILTTLSLFASLGANAYLGWLAWSFFWRYRDAASDVARARVANRQAA